MIRGGGGGGGGERRGRVFLGGGNHSGVACCIGDALCEETTGPEGCQFMISSLTMQNILSIDF